MLPPILRMDCELFELMVKTNTLPDGDFLQTTERAITSAIYRAIDSCPLKQRIDIRACLMTPGEAAEHEIRMLTPATLCSYNTLSNEQRHTLTKHNEDIVPYGYSRSTEPLFKHGTRCERCTIFAQTRTACCEALFCLRCMRTISRHSLQSTQPTPGVPCPGCKENLKEEDLMKMGRPGLVLLKRQQEREMKYQPGPDNATNSSAVFCHEETCHSFIGELNEQESADALMPVTKGEALRCGVCWARTCVVCRGPGHFPGTNCPLNEEPMEIPQDNASQVSIDSQETELEDVAVDHGVLKMPYLRGGRCLSRCWTRRFWHEGLLRAVNIDPKAAQAEIIEAFCISKEFCGHAHGGPPAMPVLGTTSWEAEFDSVARKTCEGSRTPLPKDLHEVVKTMMPEQCSECTVAGLHPKLWLMAHTGLAGGVQSSSTVSGIRGTLDLESPCRGKRN